MKKVINISIKKMHYSLLITAIVFGLITIIASGGGGNGSSGIQYTGPTNPTNIDSNNAVDLATGALMGYNFGTGTGTLGVQSDEHMHTGCFSTMIVAQKVIERAIHKVHQNSPSINAVSSATQCEDEMLEGDCGGRLHTHLCLNEFSWDFEGYLNYSKYCSTGFTVSGRADFYGNIDIYTFDMHMNINMDMRSLDNTTGKVYWMEDYNMNGNLGMNYMDITIVTGRYYDPDYGSVDDIHTPVPVYIYISNYYPSSGALSIEGASGTVGGSTMAWLHILSSNTYYVEADTNGDDTIDYNSGELNW